MTIEEFEAASAEELDGALLALWWDGRGDWERAHETAQDIAGPEGPGCMLICTGRRVILGTPCIGISGRDERWHRGIFVRSGRGLCGRCWGVE
jgi:hypothetical protein